MTDTALRHFLTAPDGGARLTEQARLAPHEGRTAGPVLTVNSERRFQTLLGFGAAFTEAAAVTWQRLAPAQRDQLLCDFFSQGAGHGCRICRVHMNSCDFALGNYAHVETPGDTALTGFNIDRDRRAVLPFI
jgi:glucosylceramidase